MNSSGIYLIVNLINGMFYVGSTICFKDRWCVHRNQLNTNLHKSTYLQNAWNKYGEEAFQFIIVEIVEDRNKLEEIEQLWMDASNCYNSKFGYNLRTKAYSNKGIKRTKESIAKVVNFHKGRKRSAQSIINISNGQKGRKQTKEHIANRVKAIKKSSKWPHELGDKCKCEECLYEFRKYNRVRTNIYYHKKKLERLAL